jgi:hypothetical protein
LLYSNKQACQVFRNSHLNFRRTCK